MKYEWDPVKNSANLKKHGLDFQDAQEVFAGPTATIIDDRVDYGETRFITLGLLRGVLVVVMVHTDRDDEVVRIISMRKATAKEAKFYEENASL